MVVHQSEQDSGFDLSELLSRVEGDYELMQDIFELFKDEFPKAYQILTAALTSNDLKQVQFSAHILKGMLSSLSFVQASACARRIGLMARVEQRDGIDEEVDFLEQTAILAQASLQRACLAVCW